MFHSSRIVSKYSVYSESAPDALGEKNKPEDIIVWPELKFGKKKKKNHIFECRSEFLDKNQPKRPKKCLDKNLKKMALSDHVFISIFRGPAQGHLRKFKSLCLVIL